MFSRNNENGTPTARQVCFFYMPCFIVDVLRPTVDDQLIRGRETRAMGGLHCRDSTDVSKTLGGQLEESR